MEWRENAFRLHRLTFIKEFNSTPSGISFPRLHGSSLTASEPALVYSAQRGVASRAAFENDAKEQTAEQVITCFPIHHHPNGTCALLNVDKELVT